VVSMLVNVPASAVRTIVASLFATRSASHRPMIHMYTSTTRLPAVKLFQGATTNATSLARATPTIGCNAVTSQATSIALPIHASTPSDKSKVQEIGLDILLHWARTAVRCCGQIWSPSILRPVGLKGTE
jgi:hypothetical protein